MNSKSGIYKIKNIITGRSYIGRSVNVHNRVCSHFNLLRNNRHKNFRIQKDFNEYGEDNFIYGIIKFTENEIVAERFYIDQYEPFYNIGDVCHDKNRCDLLKVLKYFYCFVENAEYLYSTNGKMKFELQLPRGKLNSHEIFYIKKKIKNYSGLVSFRLSLPTENWNEASVTIRNSN